MTKYKLCLLSIFFGLTLVSCRVNIKSEKITGNLYYQIFGFRSLYNLPDSMAKQMELRYKNLPDSVIAEKKLISIIIERNLKNSPYIFIKRKNGKVVTVYMEKSQYEQFTKFRYRELIDKNQKIFIKLKAKKLIDKYYQCISITSVRIKKGQTLGKQGKLLLYEYE